MSLSHLAIATVLFTCILPQAPKVLPAISQKTDLSGAWVASQTINGQQLTHTLIMAGNYFSLATYAAAGGEFVSSVGGSYTNTDKAITIAVEFNTSNTSTVGQTTVLHLIVSNNGFSVYSSDKTIAYEFVNVDKGGPGNLAGPWLITGRRASDGTMTAMETGRPRKTMKILSGTCFQWIAYNTETGEFFGTGGGTYSTKNGKYIENIEFFSRDKSRVGATLEFNYELKNGEWHHSGFSSKGDPLYEVWNKRK